VPDSLGVLARMTNGARATYRLSTVAANPLDVSGVAIHGDRATLHWRMGDTLALAPVDGSPAPLEPDPGTAGTWTVEREFVASIRDGAPVELTSFEDGLEYMRFTEAVWRSWNERRTVSLDEV
jgi:predicted dehydrogenase